ncbi:hypothetical protein SK128_016493 [Halocaridina rubra]|uniref:Uncharacterized protein n=1 Tax=Halocaridina rubra TaxID=373956 RepID=A0AAN9ACI1_HALRR
MDQNDRKEDRIRGIYPLLRAEINETNYDGHYFNFYIRLLTGQVVDFRVKTQALKDDWCDRFYAVASKKLEPVVVGKQASLTIYKCGQKNQITGELFEPGTFLSKKRYAVLDPSTKLLSLYSVSKGKENPKIEFPMTGATVNPDKSDGNVFDFTIRTVTG